MPVWLEITTGILVGLAAFSALMTPIGRWMYQFFTGIRNDISSLREQMEHMGEYFNHESAVAQAMGTVPDRLKRIEDHLGLHDRPNHA